MRKMNDTVLDKRIQRIRAGRSSSSGHIDAGLKRFADMKVSTMISKVFHDVERNYLSRMYNSYRKDGEEITYGDLAVLIADDYLDNGIRNEDHIDSLILFYCTSLEFARCYQKMTEEKKTAISRDKYIDLLGLTDIKGFIDLRVDEYIQTVRNYDLPEENRKWLYAFSIEKRGLLTMPLHEIYSLLNDHAFIKDVRLHDPVNARFSANSTLIRKQLIELLVMPVACLAVKNDKGINEMRKEEGYGYVQ